MFHDFLRAVLILSVERLISELWNQEKARMRYAEYNQPLHKVAISRVLI